MDPTGSHYRRSLPDLPPLCVSCGQQTLVTPACLRMGLDALPPAVAAAAECSLSEGPVGLPVRPPPVTELPSTPVPLRHSTEGRSLLSIHRHHQIKDMGTDRISMARPTRVTLGASRMEWNYSSRIKPISHNEVVIQCTRLPLDRHQVKGEMGSSGSNGVCSTVHGMCRLRSICCGGWILLYMGIANESGAHVYRHPYSSSNQNRNSTFGCLAGLILSKP